MYKFITSELLELEKQKILLVIVPIRVLSL